MAFLDINPANKGHALVIPKIHAETMIAMKKEDFEELTGVVYSIAKAVLKAVKCDGFNVLINNKKVAGQVVPHVHIHIIPRFDSDTFKLTWPQSPYEEGELDKIKMIYQSTPQ